MPSCALRDCKSDFRNTNKELNGVTYHSFPKIGIKRDKWIKFVRRNRRDDEWTPNNRSLICSKHFKPEDKKITKSGRVFLKNTAEPFDASTLAPAARRDSSTSTDSCLNSPDSIDNAREIYLKQHLMKEIHSRIILSIKFKKMRRQNRYLKEKCQAYKAQVKDLKDQLANSQGINNNNKIRLVSKTRNPRSQNKLKPGSAQALKRNQVQNKSIPIRKRNQHLVNKSVATQRKNLVQYQPSSEVKTEINQVQIKTEPTDDLEDKTELFEVNVTIKREPENVI